MHVVITKNVILYEIILRGTSRGTFKRSNAPLNTPSQNAHFLPSTKRNSFRILCSRVEPWPSLFTLHVASVHSAVGMSN